MLNRFVKRSNSQVIEQVNKLFPDIDGNGVISTEFPFAGKMIKTVTPLNKYRSALGWNVKKGRPPITSAW
jgi:hypothetical protein